MTNLSPSRPIAVKLVDLLPQSLRPFATATMLTYLAALASAGLLGTAFFFQHVIGLAPCEMCIWQRWPHVVVMAAGLLALVLRPARWISGIGALAMFTNAGLGLLHTGVERGWWEGPTTCSGGFGTDLSTDQLLSTIMTAPVVRCDEVAWELFHLSMSSWSGISSLCLGILWLLIWQLQGSSTSSQYK